MNRWNPLNRADCFPDCSCEFNSEALLAQPEAFFTSIPFIVFAIILYVQVLKKDLELKLWTASTILLGIGSLYTHARFTKLAVAMDFASMVILMSFFAFMRVMQDKQRTPKQTVINWIFYYISLNVGFLYFSRWSKVVLTTLLFMASMTDIIHTLRGEFLKADKVQWALFVLIASFIFFLKDELRVGCEPHGYLFGHSLWHLGSSYSIFLFGKWYFQDRLISRAAQRKA